MNKVSDRNKKSNNRLYSLLILLAFLGFVIYFAVTFIKQEIKISQLRNDAQSVQEKVEEQVQYSKELEENMKTENEIIDDVYDNYENCYQITPEELNQ